METIIATQSVIDMAFNHNQDFVKAIFLVDAFITHVEPGNGLIMLSGGKNPLIKATKSCLFIPAVSKTAILLSKEELKKCVLGWMFDDGIEAVDFLIGNPIVNISTDPFSKKTNLELGWDGLLQCDGRFQIGENLFFKLDYLENTCGITFYTSSNTLFDGVPSEVANQWIYYGTNFDKVSIAAYSKSRFTLSSNDTIYIKFEDESILEFKSIKKTNYSCVLHQEDFDALTKKKIVATRISFGKGDKDPISMEFQNSIFDTYSYLALVLYFRKYVATIMEIHPHYNLPDRTMDNGSQDCCYVYLMQDTTNGYYKIGISNTPEYRERTLQSEKPTIEMIACKKFPTRKIAASIESALHTSYSQQRLRGEWFNLTDADVAAIIETLK